MSLAKLHIANCAFEVIGDTTYTLPLDQLDVQADFNVKEWQLANEIIQQAIGKTRLFLNLSWGFFEPAAGATSIGHMAMVKKFQDGLQVFLIPDASQPDKFEVLLDFKRLNQIASVQKGIIQKGTSLPFFTKSRLTATELQFFNFI